MSMVRRYVLALTTLSFVLAAGAAFAQETPSQTEGLIEAAGTGLVEKTETKKKKDAKVDPDAKLGEKAKKANAEVEARLSKFSSKKERFLDISEGLSRIQGEFFEAQGQYYQNNTTTLENFQLAHEQKDAKKKKKWAKTNTKVRKIFLKAVKRTNKDLDKLEKLEKKLEKQAAEEDAEDAANAEEGEEDSEDDDDF